MADERVEGAAEIEAALAKLGQPEPVALDPELLEAIQKLGETEEELGLEYVGRARGMNRAQRRDVERTVQRVTRRPVACLTLRHPLLNTLTPYGAKRLHRRRARRKAARAMQRKQRRLT